MADNKHNDKKSFEEFWNKTTEKTVGKLRQSKTKLSQVNDADYVQSYRENSEERDYRPVRQRRDSRTGILGGFMYFVFVVSISVILACVGWMAASDVLALNKAPREAEVVIPEEVFSTEVIDKENADGTIVNESAQTADMGEVAAILKNAGIIEYKTLFRFYSFISDAKYKIDPGTYSLSTEFDYRAIVKKMQFGSESQVRTKITFPEGFNIHQIFTRLEENKICKYDDLIECAANYEFSTERYPFLEGIPYGDATRLEGFLFPDTYEFYQGMTPQSAIDTFLQIYKARITAEMLDWIESSGYSQRDIMNIASMIEKETSGSTEDRKNIASVIFNRLKAGMSLGVDATSIYSHWNFDGDYATMIDTWVADSSDPYNTRTNLGLPPTPIGNPGIASINAALKPNNTNYYYYALNSSTGEHEFFTNSNDFNAFVASQSY